MTFYKFKTALNLDESELKNCIKHVSKFASMIEAVMLDDTEIPSTLITTRDGL